MESQHAYDSTTVLHRVWVCHLWNAGTWGVLGSGGPVDGVDRHHVWETPLAWMSWELGVVGTWVSQVDE